MAVFHHIALTCKDIKAQEDFYCTHLGFRHVRTFRAGEPNEFIMLRTKGACLELFQTPQWQSDARGGEQPVGFRHMAFLVDDLTEKIASLTASGIVVEETLDLSSMLNGLKICFFYDPEGNRIEIMQGYSDE